jgi:hypothetical protein
VVVASPFIGQSGHRLLEFGIFATALTLIILVPYVIDLLKGSETSGLSRATMANAIVISIALVLGLLVIEKPFGNNLGLARLVLVALTTTLASVVAFYFGGKIATDAAAQAASNTTTAAAPAITITTPTEGATYTVGQNVTAGYSCTSPSGTATCTGKIVGGAEVANGDPLPVTTAGEFVFEVTAVDSTGATNTVRVKYTVA